MKNLMHIDGYDAVVTYDPDIDQFRGEFVGLNGGADFYAADLKGLKREGRISLKIFLQACEEDGVSPRKPYSGKFMVRVDPKIHAAVVTAAAANGVSMNEWVAQAIERAAA